MSVDLCFGVGLRLLALVYVIAFASLHRDLPGLAGSRGVYPVGDVAFRQRIDFGWRRFLFAPSILHVANSDRALSTWPVLGATAALLASAGAPHSSLWFFIAWAIYLSLDLAVDLFYPWDALLLEAGFLALFAPEISLLPSLTVAAEPSPVLGFAYRFLAFRVVFGFGKYKFFGPGRFTSGYLRQFLVTQPLPRPLGLWATRLPLPVHQFALAGVFVVEIVLPWLWLGPSTYRVVASVACAVLMVSIQVTGNFGFFNVGLVPILVLAAAPQSSAFDLGRGTAPFTSDAPHLAGCVLIALGLIHLPFNSWVARSWMYWPSLGNLAHGAFRPLLAFVRLLAPFRLVHAYGVFGPLSGPSVQWVPIFEGSCDGVHFEPYRYRYYPSDDAFRGVRVAPLFPRFDHSVIYEAMGLGLGNLFGSVVGGGHPHRASRALYFQRVARRLLEGSNEVLCLFARAPFGDQAPSIVRVRMQMLVWDGMRFTAHCVGDHLPPATLPSAEPLDLPKPAEFLADDRIWTQRALGALDPAAELQSSGARELFSRLDGIRARDRIIVAARGDVDDEGDFVRQRLLLLGEEWSEALRSSEGAAMRLAWTLRARTVPLPGEGEFELGLRCLRVVLGGRLEVEAALNNPSRALASFSLDEGICALALLRPGWIRFHASKAALRVVTLRGSAAKTPSFAPGILRVNERLAVLFPDRTLRLPRFIEHPIKGFVLENATPERPAMRRRA